MKIEYGRIEEQNLTGAVHKYRVRLSTGELSPWCPALVSVAGDDRHNQAYTLGTQVALMMDNYEGLILGALNYDQKPATTDRDTLNRAVYRDGAVIEYDSQSHALTATLPAGATTTLISDGGITINGNITLTGDINQTGKITSTGDHIAGGISLINHTHPGDSGGTTGAAQ